MIQKAKRPKPECCTQKYSPDELKPETPEDAATLPAAKATPQARQWDLVGARGLVLLRSLVSLTLRP